ncbi:hypothetical protein MNBD_NITROSPINAE01-416 [hydrothermal vent metagenome]|uniref:Uncharacterized protein n=1 Tax=hydrothermal vent metagenome TaxID=652676 RepID=A0A3B1CAC8_9ZZZZ
MGRDNLDEDIRWLEHEESAAYAIDSIKGTIERFRHGMLILKETRARLKKKLDDAINEMENTKKSLKEAGAKIGELSDKIKQISSGYVHVKAKESSTKERYNKLLSGGMPIAGDSSQIDAGNSLDDDFDKRKDEFLRGITGAFAKLDEELKQLRAEEDGMRHKKDALGRTVKTLKLGRAVYFRKIHKLRADIASIQSERRDNKENEEALLREFFNFTERLKVVSGATEVTERRLLQTEAALKNAEIGGIASGKAT